MLLHEVLEKAAASFLIFRRRSVLCGNENDAVALDFLNCMPFARRRCCCSLTLAHSSCRRSRTSSPTAVFDRDVLTFHETGFVETFAERGHIEHPGVDRTGTEKSDHRHRRLLPPRALHLNREQQTPARTRAMNSRRLRSSMGDLLPYAYQSRRLARAQSSAASACRRAAGKSLGKT